MKPKVYVESSVISYLTARPSRDLIVRANQMLTKQWWKTASLRFELFVSAVVIKEIEAGDKTAAKSRVAIADALDLIDVQAEAITMARAIVERGALPKKAEVDALHIAIASYARHDFLVTWNCRHIANAEIRKSIEVVARALNVNCPIICTPQELMGTRRGLK
jgi:hypothetical protein